MDEDLAAVAQGPEIDVLKAEHRDAFQEAFASAFRALPRDQRNLLRLQFLDGLSIDKLASLHRAHRATIARRVEVARAAVFEATRVELSRRLRLTESELHSLVVLLRSQLDPRIEELLATEG